MLGMLTYILSVHANNRALPGTVGALCITQHMVWELLRHNMS
jgi:hypothetical protein